MDIGRNSKDSPELPGIKLAMSSEIPEYATQQTRAAAGLVFVRGN
jgi:hypothetical protein